MVVIFIGWEMQETEYQSDQRFRNKYFWFEWCSLIALTSVAVVYILHDGQSLGKEMTAVTRNPMVWRRGQQTNLRPQGRGPGSLRFHRPFAIPSTLFLGVHGAVFELWCMYECDGCGLGPSLKFSLILVRVKLKPPLSVNERWQRRERRLDLYGRRFFVRAAADFFVAVLLVLLLLLLLLLVLLLVLLLLVYLVRLHGRADHVAALGRGRRVLLLQQSHHVVAGHDVGIHCVFSVTGQLQLLVAVVVRAAVVSVVSVGWRMVQLSGGAHQLLHAGCGREQAGRAVLRLYGVRRAAKPVVVVVGVVGVVGVVVGVTAVVVERVLNGERRLRAVVHAVTAVEQVEVCQFPVTGGRGSCRGRVAPWLGASECDRWAASQWRGHVAAERGERGEGRGADHRRRGRRRGWERGRAQGVERVRGARWRLGPIVERALARIGQVYSFARWLALPPLGSAILEPHLDAGFTQL